MIFQLQQNKLITKKIKTVIKPFLFSNKTKTKTCENFFFNHIKQNCLQSHKKLQKTQSNKNKNHSASSMHRHVPWRRYSSRCLILEEGGAVHAHECVGHGDEGEEVLCGDRAGDLPVGTRRVDVGFLRPRKPRGVLQHEECRAFMNKINANKSGPSTCFQRIFHHYIIVLISFFKTWNIFYERGIWPNVCAV